MLCSLMSIFGGKKFRLQLYVLDVTGIVQRIYLMLYSLALGLRRYDFVHLLALFGPSLALVECGMPWCFFFKYDGGSKFHLFLIICWFLWWDQNVWIAEGVQLEPYFMVAKAETFLLSYKEVHETLAREVIRAPVNWVKLSDPWIQINTDAALSLFSLGRGFGMVGRDSCWTTFFAKTSKCFSSVVVNVAKAMSIFVAVEEAIFCGFSLVEIENDSLLVV